MSIATNLLLQQVLNNNDRVNNKSKVNYLTESQKTKSSFFAFNNLGHVNLNSIEYTPSPKKKKM